MQFQILNIINNKILPMLLKSVKSEERQRNQIGYEVP